MSSKSMFKVKSRRPLTLHVSALSDVEYTAYTDWLSEIVGPLDGVRGTSAYKEDGGYFGNDTPFENKDRAISRTRICDSDWDPEETLVSVREARGWIRGRWGSGLHALDGTVIDSILKKFSPDLAAQDVITGGQFFAVMRLVCHAQEQKQSQNPQDSTTLTDESLVFVQANPYYNPVESTKPPHKKASSATSVEPDLSTSVSSMKLKHPPPPVPPPRQSSEIQPNQTQHAVPCETNGLPNVPALPPRQPSSTINTTPNSNPFSRSRAPSLPTTEKPAPAIKNATSSASESSRNPFRLIKPPPPPPPPLLPTTQNSTALSESDDSSSAPSRRQTNGAPLPPLPPRKTVLLPPPRHASIKPTPQHFHSHSITPGIPTTTYVPPLLPPPVPPPKPPKVTSPLIKQSLEAAKNAQNIRASLDNLSRERQLEVIKKSGNTTGFTALRKSDGERLTARSMSPPRSMYDVATAQLSTQPMVSSTSASTSVSSFSSTSVSSSGSNGKKAGPISLGLKPKLLADTNLSNASTSHTSVSPHIPSTSPFTPSPFSPGGNPRRTKSLHYPSPSTGTPRSALEFPFPVSPLDSSNQPPPPPRRRPESIQVFRSINEANTPVNVHSPNPFTLSKEQGQGQTSDWPPPKLASFNLQSPRRTSGTAMATMHSSEPTPSHSLNSPSVASASAMFDSIQRTFSNLTLKSGPGFESARIRAEGRVLPSGFSKVGGKRRGVEKERLMDDVDDEYDYLNELERGRRTERIAKNDTGLSEISQDSGMDNLKIPVHPNEGWVSLT